MWESSLTNEHEVEFREPDQLDREKLFKRFPQLRQPEPDLELYYYDEDAAYQAVCFFINELHHVEGPQRGQPFELEPWQQFIVEETYGWKVKTYDENGNWINTEEQRAHDSRRYKEVFIFIPRKNGKSFLGAGFGIAGLFFDNEPGPRVVSAAAEKEQAALIYDVAREIVEGNSRLDERAECYKRVMVAPELAGNYQVLSADVKSKHGRNLSTIIVDEVHAQPNRDLIDVLFTSVGVRSQPLKLMLTTAGYDRLSVCFEYYDYAKKVLTGIVDDQEFFPVIFEATENDDWKEETTWFKANPNLDVSITLDYMRSECRKAIERPSYENTFKRLHLNMWTEQETRWVPIEVWDASAGEFDHQQLWGRDCYAGVDLSSKVDLTALCLVFPFYGGENGTVIEKIQVIWHYWMPKDNVLLRKKRDRVDYDVWIREGLITATTGNVVDYDYIRTHINDIRKEHNILSIRFDPWNAVQIANALEGDGFEVVEVPQSYSELTDPTKEIEARLLSRQLEHGGNKVARWNFSNIAVIEDGNGNIKFSKKKAKERTDGMVALANAMHGLLAAEKKKESVYKRRPIRSLG